MWSSSLYSMTLKIVHNFGSPHIDGLCCIGDSHYELFRCYIPIIIFANFVSHLEIKEKSYGNMFKGGYR